MGRFGPAVIKAGKLSVVGTVRVRSYSVLVSLQNIVVPCVFALHDAELKWLTPLPIFMQNQSGGDRVAFGVPHPTGR